MTITVRQWFRLQRVVLWDREDAFNGVVQSVAHAVVRGESPYQRLYLAPDVVLHWNYADRAAAKHAIDRELVCDLIRYDMRIGWLRRGLDG